MPLVIHRLSTGNSLWIKRAGERAGAPQRAGSYRRVYLALKVLVRKLAERESATRRSTLPPYKGGSAARCATQRDSKAVIHR